MQGGWVVRKKLCDLFFSLLRFFVSTNTLLPSQEWTIQWRHVDSDINKQNRNNKETNDLQVSQQAPSVPGRLLLSFMKD